jgi:hypothetical protein
MLELIPTGGLCNKMRAIDSAISFCATYDIPLKVYWKKDEKLINCRFRDLFEPIKNLELYEVDRLPFKFREGKKENFFLPNLLRKMPWEGTVFKGFDVKHYLKSGGDFKKLYDEHQRLVFYSFSRFFPSEKEFAIYKPLPIVQRMIEKETEDFDGFTIGIHIRRTDHKIAIKNSPLELFEQKIEEEISKNERVNFYLASDCSDTKNHLVNKYGTIIRTDFEPGDRTTLEGMYRGITELYALSKTAKVYGSCKSSYSRTACEMTEIELIYVM